MNANLTLSRGGPELTIYKKITRRTAGARGCYFKTSVYQVMQSKFEFRLNFKKHVTCNENSAESIEYHVCSQDLFTIIRNQVSSDNH